MLNPIKSINIPFINGPTNSPNTYAEVYKPDDMSLIKYSLSDLNSYSLISINLGTEGTTINANPKAHIDIPKITKYKCWSKSSFSGPRKKYPKDPIAPPNKR